MLTDAAYHERDPERVKAYVDAGYWTDDTLGSMLRTRLTERPDLPFVVHSVVRPYRGTFADVDDLALRIASGLLAHGVRPGEPVAFQLPSWLEAAATWAAVAYVGAIAVPIVHFYGIKEVGFILQQSRARVHITVDRFGHVDMLGNLEQLRPSLDALELVFVLGDTLGDTPGGDAAPGTRPFSGLSDHAPLERPTQVDPNAPALVIYTSGTTADPKGVVHSHRTMGFETRQLAALMSSTAPPILVGAPIAHAIGMLSGLLIPVWNRQAVHLIDVWDAGRVLDIMLEEQISSGMGSTIFLTSLLDHPKYSAAHAALMPVSGLGGSPVPAAVGERAASLGIASYRSYGSSEHPSITGCRFDEPAEKRIYTDGRPMEGNEIRLVDDDGRDVAPGEPGEVWSRGPECFLGYTNPELTQKVFQHDDWYATGDIGVLDADGYLTIVDRKSDIIIRGGTNVSAAEVEEVLLHMPGVAEVALVAAPDERLGEHGCAFVRPLPGATAPTLVEVQAAMEQAGLAKQKWPEEVRGIDEFPRSASGKIQKFVLRQGLRDEAGGARPT
jgi:acyl-CoA synthetase (AMP-forming)/AMP-acid ligase II